MAETIVNKYHNQYDYTNATLDASNIQFLSGSQAQLNKYLLDSGDATYSGKAKEGAFYLTTDTHRLYIGRAVTVSGATKYVPVPVNEGIETVATVSALQSITANQGEFYYITESNILAVRSGNSWVQLNTDTNIGNVESLITPHTTNSVINSVDVATTITDTAGSTFGTNTLDKWQLIPGNNVTFSYTAPVTTAGSEASAKLTITAIDTTYTLGTTSSTATDGGKIKITPNSGTASTVTLKATTTKKHGDLEVSSDANGNVTFDLDEVDGVSVSAHTYDSSAADTSTGFDIVPVIAGTERTFDSDSSFTSRLDPAISYGASTMGLGSGESLSSVSSGTTTAKFQDGTATLDVYSRLQTEKRIEDVVNSKIQVADALTYKGTATYNSSTSNWTYNPSTTTFSKGDVYKVAGIGNGVTIGGIAVQVGDLLIANGTENNGTITAASLSWDVIPSGNEPTYSASVNNTNHAISLVESLNGTEVGTVAQTTYKATPSAWLTVSTSGTASAFEVTYTHAGSDSATLPNFTQTANQDNKLTYTGAPADDTISFLALDTTSPLTISKGHVTAINGKKVTISLNKLDALYTSASSYSSAELTSAGVKSAAKLNLFADDVKGNSTYLTSKEIRYTSNTLNITGSSSGTGTGSYGIVNVDLKWGTF